jgi:glycosyltransferase involved in cell wall biosynthesis
MTAVAVVMLLFVIVRKLIFGDPVAGWASTICVIIFIGGLQLFCLGIIGQYVARIFTETKNRPHYIASESNLKDARMIR